jgi:hypothetical protein
MLTIYPTDLSGNVHEVAPDNSARVTRSKLYRMSWADIVDRDDSRFGALTEVFPEPYRPAGTFGVAGMESQEHSILWIGQPGVIARFRDDPEHVVPWAELHEQATWVDRWPNSRAWLEFIPATTWNPGGQGIVTELAFDGAKVIVYELLGRPALLSAGPKGDPAGPVPVVTFHCTRCHAEDTRDHRYMSASPDDRRAACQAARRHMLPGRCEGAEATARGDQMVAAVNRVFRGVPAPRDMSGLYAASCQTSEVRPDDVGAASTCAEVREARTHTPALQWSDARGWPVMAADADVVMACTARPFPIEAPRQRRICMLGIHGTGCGRRLW